MNNIISINNYYKCKKCYVVIENKIDIFCCKCEEESLKKIKNIMNISFNKIKKFVLNIKKDIEQK